MLNDGERWVLELNKQIAIPQSSLSQHLSQLRRGKLVATRLTRKLSITRWPAQ
ncbi:ArsR family transcriptional regulator [Colwellia sp. MB02u-9]|uniref:ArsR family transcriptional regulator n=1 Tax=Colwellia sp. MB02u-9 TaxID=2759823 RepID=UPI003855998F